MSTFYQILKSFFRIIQNCVIILLFFGSRFLNAQNHLGSLSDNYGGLNNLQINPASICYQPYKFDFNIIGIEAYINNNNYYTKASNTINLLFGSNLNKLVLNNSKFEKNSMNKGDLILNADIKANGYAFGGLTINGPSFLISINKKQAFSFSVNYRSAFNITQLSALTSTMLFEGPSYNEVRNRKYDFTNSKFSFANWIETGLSYAQVIINNNKYVHRFGGGLKVLWGLNAGYIYDNGFDGTNTNGRDLILNNGGFNYAYSGPFNSKKSVASDLNELRGIGSSIDLGYIIQKKSNNNLIACPDIFKINEETSNYKWKAGVSILDLGALNFYNSAFSTSVSNASLNWQNYDTIFTQNLYSIDSTLKSYIGSNLVKSSSNFWMILPSAVSLQFDYKLNNILFLNATLLQRITPAKVGSLSRMNTLSLSPRFETKAFSIAFPFSVIEYKDINFGAAIRYKYLTLGSDRIMETLGLQTIYGANLYLSFKFNILNKSGKSPFN